MLHVTNGDAAVTQLRGAELTGQFLPWRDVLHEGPVPANLPLQELSRLRADFIAACGWGRADETLRQFQARDATLQASVQEDEVVLWFESDLHDQLQLCQILDWYHEQASKPSRLSLIATDKDDERLRGASKVERIKALWDTRTAVTSDQLRLGTRAWAAFRKPDPTGLDVLRREGTPPMPELAAAVRRLFEELPSQTNGLSRTEQAALAAVADGARAPAEIFVAVHTKEERPFMGDWSFWKVLARLASGNRPLLELASGARPRFPPEVPAAAAFGAQRFRLTPAGRDALAGQLDAVKTNGIDRWLGGTHLGESSKVWRWNGASGLLVKPG
jgi:hypothetical protein